jgi:hypothetical protein
MRLQTSKTNFLPALVSGPVLQRKCACGQHTIGGGECDGCGKRLQRRAAVQAQSMRVPPIVHEVLRSPGQPLDLATRVFMEPRFGHDFGNVRIHIDSAAAKSARSVDADAYTVGRDIVFGRNVFSPNTGHGREIIAHELVHVVQQSASPSPVTPLRVDSVHSHAEREADAVARGVVTMNEAAPGHTPSIESGSGPMVSRTPIFTSDCHEYDRCKVIEPLKAANQLLDRVIAELPPLAAGTVTAGRIVDLLNVHFHDPGNVSARAGIVLNNFRAIKSELNATIRFVCHPPQQDCATTDGVAGAFTGDQPGGDIGLCVGYHGADCAEQARMLIHEVCHHIPATAIDRAYVHQPNYMTLSADHATQNPDTYAQFSKMVFLGTPACKDCSAETQLRPGQY